MRSMTDPSVKIKALLIDKTDELMDYIATAVQEGRPVHEVEKALWSRMLDFGYHAMGLYLKSLGDGDAGERVTLPNGQQAKRLEEPRIKQYLTVFGEFQIPRVVYGSREGQKIAHVPLDARWQFPAAKFSYLLHVNDHPYGAIRYSP